MESYDTHLALLTALAVGLLVGLEREQTKTERVGSQLGGIRTYPLFALVGALATMLTPAAGWLPVVALLGVFALVGLSYAADIRRASDHGMTTEISVIGVFLLGALASSRGVVEPTASRMILVAAIGVAMTFLLSSKQWFHRLATRVSREDFYATVKFLIVAVIVLPLLPNVDMGPLAAINPRSLGLMVVLISGMSFLGYAAMKLLGAKHGLLLGAALGGLVSSTAVTLSYATRTKSEPKLASVAAGAISVAWLIMLVRVGVVVAIIEPSALRRLAVPLALTLLATLAGLLATFRRSDADDAAIELQNPFELATAIKVSALFGLVLLATKAAMHYLGPEGLYIASALSGTTDVDAVVVSTAKLAQDGLDPSVATIAISIAVVMNTVVKAAMATTVGGWALGRRISLVGALIVTGAGLGIAFVALAPG